MRLSRALSSIVLLFWCLATGLVAQPQFELVPLGVFGGEIESNSSCFLLRKIGATDAVMLDCGSPVAGLLAWKEQAGSWESRMKAVQAELARVKAVFLTHSHLDHLYGFVLKSPLHVDGVLKGTTTDVYANEATIATLREAVFSGKIWGDFTRVPSPEHPVYRLQELSDGKAVEAAGLRVESVPLKHPVASSGFLVTVPSGEAYLHLGDTGASDVVWARARPLMQSGKLRAVAVETSFGSRQEKLGVLTGHLTPASLVGELEKLVGSANPAASTTAPTLEAALGRAGAVGKALGKTRVLIHHIKPSGFDEVTSELDRLRAAGLPTEVLEQGKPLTF